jgi:hypothetical protein
MQLSNLIAVPVVEKFFPRDQWSTYGIQGVGVD